MVSVYHWFRTCVEYLPTKFDNRTTCRSLVTAFLNYKGLKLGDFGPRNTESELCIWCMSIISFVLVQSTFLRNLIIVPRAVL